MGKSHDLATIADDGITSLDIGSGGLTVGTDQLAVDASGRVTMVDQPAFSAYVSSTFTNTGGYNKISTLQSTKYNRGNNYDTSLSRFVAPVSGVYSFGFQLLLSGVDTGDDGIHVAFFKNGTNELYGNLRASGSSAQNHVGYGGYLPVIGSLETSLNANDYIELAMTNQNTTYVYYSSNTAWGRFFGHLIG